MRIAITGGIGSGKSFVCRVLEDYGIRIYDCDKAAKRLMRSSAELQRQLSMAVGQDIFPDGVLQKAILSQFIVSSEKNAQIIDNVVHPAVAIDFLESGYDWLESAILFESGFNQRVPFDKIVCVTAPLETRIDRVMARDGISREKALDWINRQMSQEEKERLSDYVIINDGRKDIKEQMEELMRKLISSADSDNSNHNY